MASEKMIGGQFIIKIDSSVVAYATDFDFEVNKEVVDVTSFASAGWKEKIPNGFKDWSVSFNGLVTRTDTVNNLNYDRLLQKLKTSDLPVTIAIVPDVSGNQYESGSGYISSLKKTGGVGDKVTFSGKIDGAGALTTLNASTGTYSI